MHSGLVTALDIPGEPLDVLRRDLEATDCVGGRFDHSIRCDPFTGPVFADHLIPSASPLFTLWIAPTVSGGDLASMGAPGRSATAKANSTFRRWLGMRFSRYQPREHASAASMAGGSKNAVSDSRVSGLAPI